MSRAGEDQFDAPVGRPVELETARAWINHQYSGMSEVLERVASTALGRFDTARVLVPDDYEGELTPNNTGRWVSQEDSDELAGRIFGYLRALGAQTLIVQDELSSRDLNPEGAFYVDEAVFRSVALTEDVQQGVDLLRTGSMGYPCDAIICSRSQADLQLVVGTTLPESVMLDVVSSTVAALASVWDDESYVVMWSDAQSEEVRGP